MRQNPELEEIFEPHFTPEETETPEVTGPLWHHPACSGTRISDTEAEAPGNASESPSSATAFFQTSALLHIHKTPVKIILDTLKRKKKDMSHFPIYWGIHDSCVAVAISILVDLK